MSIHRGPLQAGEKVQLTDRKGKMLTVMLQAGAATQTDRGFLRHDTIIGQPEGSIVHTVSAQDMKRAREEAENESSESGRQQVNREAGEESSAFEAIEGGSKDAARKPWKSARSAGGWPYTVLRPRMVDFVLSMPRGAQIMYPKDIAQVLALGDIRKGMRVLESGAGSGAMSLALLDAIGATGELTTVEIRPEFARVAQGNATVYFGAQPEYWQLLVGDFDHVVPGLPEHSFDRIVLDMLDPWNRLKVAWQALAPGGVLTAYVTTTTQLSRLADALRASGAWTEPQIGESFERAWKVDGLAVRPQHQMIGHTGFLLVTRAMAPGNVALHKREHGNKDVYTDVDAPAHADQSTQPEGAPEELAGLELRDISDRKLRKVLRDLEEQEAQVQAARLDSEE
ncbi:methyltransferase [Bombiscardovia nodaiensis]|uniref:tRNA (adenine(58)-N(1))-methyltransferase TrmI n=1 Tax=Bombiscardovia nodaiensis TaxID=2932181 RepID=A0ABM8B888_9BIFI|nr:methyltransferase [Bombiscardovia nodaiensis]